MNSAAGHLVPTATGTVLVINDDSGAVRSSLAGAGVVHVNLWLEPGWANWPEIMDILGTEGPIAVLLKLSDSSMGILQQPEFLVRHEEFLSRLGTLPHLVLVDSSIVGLSRWKSEGLRDKEGSGYEVGGDFDPLEGDQRAMVLRLCDQHQLNVLPYRDNLELGVLASEFIESWRNNLLFRLYVPADNIYAEQVSDIVALFRNFLSATLNLQVRQSTHFTASGMLYEFFGDGATREKDVTRKFSEFAVVMDVCIDDRRMAEQMLMEQGVDGQVAARLAAELSRRHDGIISCIRRERERRVLKISNRLEKALAEMTSDEELDAIRDYVARVVQPDEKIKDLLGFCARDRSSELSPAPNVRSQFVERVTGLVAQELYGDVHISLEACEFLDLICKRHEADRILLQSAVYELEAADSSPERRLCAARRLEAFLSMMGEASGGEAFDDRIVSLRSYLEWQLGG